MSLGPESQGPIIAVRMAVISVLHTSITNVWHFVNWHPLNWSGKVWPAMGACQDVGHPCQHLSSRESQRSFLYGHYVVCSLPDGNSSYFNMVLFAQFFLCHAVLLPSSLPWFPLEPPLLCSKGPGHRASLGFYHNS